MTLVQSAIDPARQQRAREYSRLSRHGFFLQLGIGLVLLLTLLFTGASAMLAGVLPFPFPWSVALYLLILALGYVAIVAPLEYYQDFVLPHRYGLSTQALTDWLGDKAKALVLGLLLGLCLVIIAYWLMENIHALWWLGAALFLFLLTLLLTWLTPVVFIPMFFKLKPLEEGELKNRLLSLAGQAGVNIKNVFAMNLSSKATTANAMLSGWGKSRRIIFSDTLLQGYSWNEIEVTLAHELGHHLHRDMAKLLTVRAVAFLLAFYLASRCLGAGVALFSFQGVGYLVALPWLILVLAVFLSMFQPLLNWYNRRVELKADRSALELSRNPQAFISLMTKLTDQNLSEANPSRWIKLLFYDHPTYNERVKLAHDYFARYERSEAV